MSEPASLEVSESAKKREYKHRLNDPEYQGEKTPAELTYGPKTDRGFTDCFCCIVFIAGWAAAIAISSYSYVNGNPQQAFRPADTDGNTCGLTGTQAAKFPYLYFVELGYWNHTVCLSICPTVNSSNSTNATLILACVPNSITQDCKANSGSNGGPVVNIYDSTEFGEVVCLPTAVNLSSSFLQNVTDSIDISTEATFLADISVAKWLIIGSPFVVIVIGFIYMFFLRSFTGCVVWTLIFVYLLGFALFGLLCYLTYTNRSNADLSSTALSGYSNSTLEAVAFTCWGIAGISLLLLICLWKRITLAVAVLKCAAQFVTEVPSSLIVPPIFLVLIAGLSAWWLITGVYVYSSGTIQPNQQNYPINTVVWSATIRTFWYYHLFFGAWNCFFIIGLSQFTVASMACIWYFAQGRKEPIGRPLFQALCRGTFYHLGSVAFGSLILAIVFLIKLLLDYLHKHLKEFGEKSGEAKIVDAAYKCVNCCIECFERFIRFITRHAYIQVAMTGKGFCASAEEAFFLTLRNGVRFGVVHSIGSFFVFFGELCITIISMILAYVIVTNTTYYRANLFSSVLPVLLVGLISYLISSTFMVIYGMASDTIIHCFCMDEEIHTSSKYAPPLLQSFVSNHASATEDSGKK